jgi:hypothetical protein
MYSITAIPTVYNERRYRSRLEAKWASFFDLVGWRHEYEPMDLGKWSPDFALFPSGGGRIYVEVKPITQIDRAVADRIGQYAVPGETEVLLLGLAPGPSTLGAPLSRTSLGWTTDASYKEVWFEEALLVWSESTGNMDYSHAYGCYRGRVSGCQAHKSDPVSLDSLNRHWSEACNRVQWHKR